MSDAKYLTADEIVERYRGEVSAGTLRNWRAQRVATSGLDASPRGDPAGFATDQKDMVITVERA